MGLDQNMYRFNKHLTNTARNFANDNSKEELAYWRKSNELHQWICDHVKEVDNCEFVLISKQQLEELYNTCFDRISWLLLRSGEHKSMFDRESIVHKIHLAGFNQVKIDCFDPKIDLNQRFSSICVEAIK